jgi:hypothetical protein
VDDYDMRTRHPRRRSHQQHAPADQHAAALGVEPPVYAHVPIPWSDGQLSSGTAP